jgi:ribose 5-phosphate isomerase B
VKIFLGADHRGYELKEKIKEHLGKLGYEVEDLGAFSYDKDDDYVDFAAGVAKRVSKDEKMRGVLVCGSGHGVDIVANRYSGVRSILGFNKSVVKQGREHEDVNVLCLAADWVSESEAMELVELFLDSSFFGEERHRRRIKKIEEISS